MESVVKVMRRNGLLIHLLITRGGFLSGRQMGMEGFALLIGIEFVERLSYYGIASNLIMYLTTVLQQDMKTAASNVRLVRSESVVPVVAGFLADAYMGRFWMVLISSLIYVMEGHGPCGPPGSVPDGVHHPSSDQQAAFLRTYALQHFLALYLVNEGILSGDLGDTETTEILKKTMKRLL